MQTIQQPNVLGKAAAAKLHQLTLDFRIERVYFHPAAPNQPGHLLIIPAARSDTEAVQNRKWVRNLPTNDNILPHVISFLQWEYGLRRGNPFMPFYSRTGFETYRHPDAADFAVPGWKKRKPAFQQYRGSFYHDHDLWATEIRSFQETEAPAAVFFTFLTLLAHDITYLEELYTGLSFSGMDLHQRIHRLLPYFPEISRWFVKENGTEYYLINQLERAKAELSDNGDAYVNYELLQAVQTTESNLYDAVTSRFKFLKSAIKQFPEENRMETPVPVAVDKTLNEILNALKPYPGIGEIYFFHKTIVNNKPAYYFLLIGDKMGSGFLNRAKQSLKSRMPEVGIVLIGHAREWVQKELWVSQRFFQKAMQPQNRVFASSPGIPGIHWEHPVKCEYPDLSYYAKAAEMMAENYHALRENTGKKNSEGLSLLFSHTLLRVLQVICFGSLSYHPLHLSLETVWHLCLYGNPELEKMGFLFDKLYKGQFFPIVSRSLHYNPKMSLCPKQGLKIQDEILNILATEMKNIVKGLENQNA